MPRNTEEVAKVVEGLVRYALERELIGPEELHFARNSLLGLLKLETPWSESGPLSSKPLTEYLEILLDYAREHSLIEGDTQTDKDLFDTRIMGLLTPSPKEVARRFSAYRSVDSSETTNWFYQLCIDTNYIRMDRIQKNKKWRSKTEYGELEITINLSKPEKDPVEIAAEKDKPQTGYPRCLLCVENVGFYGNLRHPARQNLRVIPLTLGGEPWFLQYSPYVYYNEHCIVLSEEHRPMKLDQKTFVRLFDFLDQFPHYFIGSNADLPVVGGSILNHDHFQGGRVTMPMEKALIEQRYTLRRFSSVEIGRIRWPMSALRLRSEDRQALTDASTALLEYWRSYSDTSVEVVARTDAPHNTITPIARKTRDGRYEIDLVLRNNRSSPEYPLGIFHPHPELHAIKKENVGLIEVMGLAILPGRLNGEMQQIQERLVDDRPPDFAALDPSHALYKHQAWVNRLISEKGVGHTPEQALSFIQEEVARRFSTVLEHCGVFKREAKGFAAFDRFVYNFNQIRESTGG
ncbi:MAG: UDP-glucose--hexose-1-phosphate uridylyltransferase [Thermotogota bacterium]|nr:UDP-glucose--hexose-1-phosphate uridylyltransferase [Thermotogota bacterium]